MFTRSQIITSTKKRLSLVSCSFRNLFHSNLFLRQLHNSSMSHSGPRNQVLSPDNICVISTSLAGQLSTSIWLSFCLPSGVMSIMMSLIGFIAVLAFLCFALLYSVSEVHVLSLVYSKYIWLRYRAYSHDVTNAAFNWNTCGIYLRRVDKAQWHNRKELCLTSSYQT